MIKKALFEEELIAGMQQNLTGQTVDNLSSAVDYLNSAAQIFEEAGMKVQADQVIALLAKIAATYKRPADPRKIPDRHTKGLDPDKMIKNLLHHGTPFNMADDGAIQVDDNQADDLLDAEIDDNNLEVTEADYQSSFEDEK